MKRIFPKQYWKKASGEIMSFVITVPCLFVLILSMLGVAQIGIEDQILNFCAYNCCRAAVVSTDFEPAKDRAIAIYAEQYNIDENTVEANNYVTLEILGVSEGEEAKAWIKGALVKCTIVRKVDSMLPFVSGTRTETIVMMVENGGVM